MAGKIIFLGGIFLDDQKRMIEENSVGVVQNAADALQKAFLSGIEATTARKVALVNLPFVNSYPGGYRGKSFPALRTTLYGRIEVFGMGFFNLQFLRWGTRFAAALRGLRQAATANCEPGSPDTIIVYAAYLPFLSAALLHRLFHRGTRICLILPDLPEFMGSGGFLYRKGKAVESAIFFAMARRIDRFVLLTKFMAERLALGPDRFVVVEGIHRPDQNDAATAMPAGPGRIFLYAGTLASRYGILDLLDAFEALREPQYQLWICGDGDAREAVKSLCARDPRVTYHGQIPREQALALQSKAHVLVNPRRPEGEFTKYSFPSKTMEYLASGRAIVMHRLPGMPDEYLDHIIAPASSDAQGLQAALQQTAEMSDAELGARGAAGREFVLMQKNPAAQCQRLVDMLAQPAVKRT